ncbi:stalk domain-containing protein [Paenibacillus sp. PK4536]|uniref:stalk domain-containing protein n=1 Tax=Paenibacillus TaxID=44249 RepID=UPI00235A3997|nr:MULTISPECIES: stalk domain-containing protein [Paenibacillus]WIM40032.1 stalk domain-containing protein [Paenibacillus sp. PK4536]CAJ1317626.1 Cu-amine-oxidN1 domain-containing protein [Paenibacillus nuruki]
MSKKKWIIPIYIAAMALTGSAGVYASSTLESITASLNHNLNIEVSGKAYKPTGPNGESLSPIVYQGTTYLPVRSISEALNTDVNYDSSNNKISIMPKSSSATSKPASTSTTPNVAPTTPTVNEKNSINTSTPSATTPPPVIETLNPNDSGRIDVAGTAPEVVTSVVPVNPALSVVNTPLITTKYLPLDFPFPSDTTSISLRESVAGDKKQLLMIYATQMDLVTLGNAYQAYYGAQGVVESNTRIQPDTLSLVGTKNNAFGFSIQGNPRSIAPGYNQIRVTLVQQ